MRQHTTLLSAACTFAILVTGCLPLWEARDLRERIDELESEQQSLKEEYADQRDKFKKMISDAQSEVDTLRQVLKEARKLLQRNSADLGAEMQQLREQVQTLRGKIQETKFELKRLRKEFELFRTNVEMEMVTELPEEPEKLFKHAKSQYDKGNYRAARNAFSTYLRKHAEGDRADDAQFFLAKTHFEQQNWRVAIRQFQAVMSDFPDSSTTPAAIYHIGVGFIRLGKCESARPFFETILAEHGASDVAGDARSRLDDIESGACAPDQ